MFFICGLFAGYFWHSHEIFKGYVFGGYELNIGIYPEANKHTSRYVRKHGEMALVHT